MKRILLCVLLASGVFAARPAWAEEEKTPAIKFTLHPAAEPRPALKYQLLPGFLDRKPGNAAVTYNKAMFHIYRNNPGDEDLQEQLSAWMETPLTELPCDEVEKKLRYSWVFDEVARAARQETCDWQLPMREAENPMEIWLPEIQETRTLARLLAAKARLQIAKGQYDEAVHTLQTGCALGRHVAEVPCLVGALVGMAITNIMSEQLEAFIQQPDSPNLYWALSTLPQPIISLHKALEVEVVWPYLMVPELRHVDRSQNNDPEYWQSVLAHLLEELEVQFDLVSGNGQALKSELPTVAQALERCPEARAALIEQGRSPDRINAMADARVILLYTADTYEDFGSRSFKWHMFPYWQAKPKLDEAEQYLAKEGPKREMIRLAWRLLPGIPSAKIAEARTDRNIALLRTLEALRLYAAAHDGQLPSTLDEVTEVPIPIDPMTGKAFLYEGKGKTAVLEAPTPPGLEPKYYHKRYEIEVP